jgi:hypothetical protein
VEEKSGRDARRRKGSQVDEKGVKGRKKEFTSLSHSIFFFFLFFFFFFFSFFFFFRHYLFIATVVAGDDTANQVHVA